jgi:branched-subunit amino acid aminotransferase/4-amino-4-deoxychorismate lyase
MSLFESIRLRGRRPLFLDAHLHRLLKACADHGFTLRAEALAEAGTLLQGLATDGFARIYATAGPGSVAEPVRDGGLYILFEERQPSPAKRYALVFGREPYHPLFGGLKTGNYWANVAPLQQAVAQGADEALLFNQQGELVSVSMANVFLIHGAAIRTPVLGGGARDGVIREWVCRHARVEECALFLDDVRSADEIFLTNSWLGIMPAGAIEGLPLPSAQISAALAERYEAAIS